MPHREKDGAPEDSLTFELLIQEYRKPKRCTHGKKYGKNAEIGCFPDRAPEHPVLKDRDKIVDSVKFHGIKPVPFRKAESKGKDDRYQYKDKKSHKVRNDKGKTHKGVSPAQRNLFLVSYGFLQCVCLLSEKLPNFKKATVFCRLLCHNWILRFIL